MELNNFHGVMAIIGGLGSTSVHRLRKTWKGLSNCLSIILILMTMDERSIHSLTSYSRDNAAEEEGLGTPPRYHGSGQSFCWISR